MTKTFLNLEGHQNRIISSKVTVILLNGEFCLLVELHREGKNIGETLFYKFGFNSRSKLNMYYQQHPNTGVVWDLSCSAEI